MYLRIDTVIKISEMRENFEKYLISFVETRAVFETFLNKLQSLVNMLELFDKDELKPTVKTKIKELLENNASMLSKLDHI